MEPKAPCEGRAGSRASLWIVTSRVPKTPRARLRTAATPSGLSREQTTRLTLGAPIRHSGWVQEAIPVLRIADAAQAVVWYRRLGYDQEWEHRFQPGFPAFVSISRKGEARIFLSEHTGDAVPEGLIYLRVGDIESIAVEFDVEIVEQPWGREVKLVDPDGNRLRVGDAAQSGYPCRRNRP